MMEIDIFKALDYIRDHAEEYAIAKANRIYVDEYRKTLKAELMQEGAKTGLQAISAQEVYAYSHPTYKTHLEAIRGAVEAEERLRWLLIGAQAKIEVFRTLQANARVEARTV